jgi:hypothetical protein
MSMVDMSFSVDKGNKWRAFMLGGSFMRGIPYKGAGTMRFWLNRSLKLQYPDAEIEHCECGCCVSKLPPC